MVINPSIFKSYDIRGIYPTDLNEEIMNDVTKAIYTFFKKKSNKENPTVVIGRDMRLSSPSLFNAAVRTLKELGAKVIDIGLVSTPTFYFAVFHYGYDCGFQITASHNPKEWNGTKIVKNTPKGLIKIGKTTGMDEIKNIAIDKTFVSSTSGGSVEKKDNVIKDEVKNALNIAGNMQIKPFKVVADAANAMGAQYIEEIFKHIPGELIKMNFELDGSFPVHQPDPLQAKNLIDLQKKVVEEKADMGFAPDGDGDRLFFIDENGNIVPPSIITGMISAEFLKNNPNETILVDIRYLLTPKKIIEENNGKMIVTKVGHAYITEEMHKSNGIFAGESSSHFFFRDTGNAESQMATILTVLGILSKINKSLSEVVEMYRRSFESGEYNFKVSNASKIMDELKEKYKDGVLNLLDGIAITYPNWRFSVRTSNTEPLLRLNIEALEKEVMEQKRDELISFIENLK